MVQALVDVMQHAKVDKRENGMSWTDLGGARVLSSSDSQRKQPTTPRPPGGGGNY